MCGERRGWDGVKRNVGRTKLAGDVGKNQRRRHEFSTGGRILTGGTVSGESKPPTPKFRFLLGFRPLYYGNIEKSKSFGNYSENFLYFWGSSSGILNWGVTSPASPRGDAHGENCCFCSKAVVNDIVKAPKECVPSIQNR